MAIDSRAIKEIILGATSQKKRDLLDKINAALETKTNATATTPAADTTATAAGVDQTKINNPASAKVVEEILDPKKAKAKKQEKTAKILGDDSIYSNITDKYHNKKDFMKTEKEEEKDMRNGTAPFLGNSNYTEEEQAAKDKLREENTAKYRDEMMKKQYDKDMEKWSKFVQSSENVDQDLMDYINRIQGSLEGTGFNKIKRERLRDGLQGLINTLIYEDDNKYTTDFLKNTSVYVAGGAHASAPEQEPNKKNTFKSFIRGINEGMAAIPRGVATAYSIFDPEGSEDLINIIKWMTDIDGTEEDGAYYLGRLYSGLGQAVSSLGGMANAGAVDPYLTNGLAGLANVSLNDQAYLNRKNYKGYDKAKVEANLEKGLRAVLDKLKNMFNKKGEESDDLYL